MSQFLIVRSSSLVFGLVVASALIMAGCEDEHYRERRRVVVEDRREVIEEPAPVVINEPPPVEVQEYYFSGGRYYYWHPRYNRYVIVDRVPRERRVVRVERLPQHYVQRGGVQVPAPGREREEYEHRRHD